MALRTAIMDADTTNLRKLPNGWGWWHVEVLTWLAAHERGLDPSIGVLQVWSILGGHHEVESAVGFRDPADGEVLIMHPGDIIEVWRD